MYDKYVLSKYLNDYYDEYIYQNNVNSYIPQKNYSWFIVCIVTVLLMSIFFKKRS